MILLFIKLLNFYSKRNSYNIKLYKFKILVVDIITLFYQFLSYSSANSLFSLFPPYMRQLNGPLTKNSFICFYYLNDCYLIYSIYYIIIIVKEGIILHKSYHLEHRNCSILYL